jgi:outer membrane protein OmpA-like peptidoglycan-associated protein
MLSLPFDRQVLQRRCSTAALVLTLLASSVASAQSVLPPPLPTGFDLEQLHIATDRNGLIDTEWAGVPDHFALDVGIWGGYENSPLVLYNESNGQRLAPLLQNRVTGALVGAIGFFGIAELGLELPFVFFQDRPSDIVGGTVTSLPSLQSFSFSDLRIVPKLQVLKAQWAFFDLAIIPAFDVPTGGATAYAGDSGATFLPSLALSKAIGGLRLGLNVGAYLRHTVTFANQTVQSELTGSLGAGYRFYENPQTADVPLEIDLGLSGDTALQHPFKVANEGSLELRGQAVVGVARWLEIFAGPGFGLSSGYGTPAWRVFAGLRFAFWNEKPTQPPPPPTPAPPAAAPAPVETPVAAPTPPPAPPAPPKPPPPPDRDHDGIPDDQDKCPDVPGVKAYQGCPVPTLAHIEPTRVSMADNVYFDTNSDKIQTRSYELLNSVALVINAHPEIKQFQVEGHTDNTGDRKKNMVLSQRRAESVVKYLLGQGVDIARLIPKGFGGSRPVDSNRTAKGRANNRRVEFNVVGPDGKVIGRTPKKTRAGK